MKIPIIRTPELNVNATSGSPPFSLPVNNPLMNIHSNDSFWNNMNAGVQNISGQLQDYGKKLQLAQDNTDINNAINKSRLSIGNYMANLNGNSDYNSYVPELLKLKENLNNADDIKKLRPEIQDAIRNKYNDIFTEAQIKVTHASRTEQIGQMKTSGLARFNHAIEVGDHAEAEREARAGKQLGYYSADEETSMLAGIKPRAAEFQVQREIEADPGNTFAMLGKRNDDGTFTHFRDLKEKEREHLRTYSNRIFEEKQKEFKLNAVELIKSQSYHGNLTLSQLEDLHSKKIVDADLYKSLRKDIEDPNRAIPLTPEPMNKMLDAENKFNNSSRSREDLNEYMNALIQYGPQLPQERRSHFGKLLDDYGKANNDKFTEKISYKSGLKFIADAYNNKDFYKDPSGIWNKQKDEITQLLGQATAQDEFHRIMKANPDMSPEESVKVSQSLVKDYQDAKVIKGFSNKYNQRKDPFGRNAALQPGAVDGGYRFKGGNPADSNNWEKVQ